MFFECQSSILTTWGLPLECLLTEKDHDVFTSFFKHVY